MPEWSQTSIPLGSMLKKVYQSLALNYFAPIFVWQNWFLAVFPRTALARRPMGAKQQEEINFAKTNVLANLLKSYSIQYFAI